MQDGQVGELCTAFMCKMGSDLLQNRSRMARSKSKECMISSYLTL
jgi:hypothetical protein